MFLELVGYLRSTAASNQTIVYNGNPFVIYAGQTTGADYLYSKLQLPLPDGIAFIHTEDRVVPINESNALTLGDQITVKTLEGDRRLLSVDELLTFLLTRFSFAAKGPKGDPGDPLQFLEQIRDSVPLEADTLNKLYELLLERRTEAQVRDQILDAIGQPVPVGRYFSSVYKVGLSLPLRQQFDRVYFDTIVADPSQCYEGQAKGTYLVPKDGVYQITAILRTSDYQQANAQFGFGVHTNEEDGTHFLWDTVRSTPPSNFNRTSVPYQRTASFKAGDRLRLFTYGDYPITISYVAMQIVFLTEMPTNR